MNTINYKQVTFAREYRKLTQSDLAKEIKGLSQPNLSKFEKGLGYLSDDVLSKIFNYLGFPDAFFELTISNNIENAHYRRKASVLKSERDQIELSNKMIGYLIDRMGESIDFPSFNFKFVDLEDGFTPKSVAGYARRFLRLDDRPVVEIISMLERNGIFIVELEEDVDAFDGVSFITDGGTPVIIINKNFSNDHKRYTIAHELGHIIMHLSRSFIFSEGRDKEKEANEFASEFLMPEDSIKKELWGLKLSSLIELKRFWQTSMASIVRRARDLGCINSDKYKYFNIELSRRGYKKEEPLNVYIDRPMLFKEAYRMHKEELEYSDEEIASAFKLPIDIITRFCTFNSSVFNLRLNV
ncbi:helix-turn-helix domain-containing protein [Parabacteroides provencensis]|uniref:helix-turn-helix domain-containing protein n=1 Tax=Parabacteroides provencensis TaxID=1944636 RepID=UPI000C153C18|nr:XRE family transcriptional regulator [Parabacteroides provencensis]